MERRKAGGDRARYMTKDNKYWLEILGIWILIGIIFLCLFCKGYFKKPDDAILVKPDPLKAAIDSVYTELKAYNWIEQGFYKEEERKYIYHEIIFVNSGFESSYNDQLIIIAYTNPTSFCHACTGFLSLFEFSKNDRKWVLTRKSIAFANGDEYGEPPQGIEILSLGNSGYAIMDHTGYSNGGHEMEFKSIYTFNGDSLKNVFGFTSYEDNQNSFFGRSHFEDWAEIRPLNRNNDYSDFELESFENTYGNKIYHFEDSVYIEIKPKVIETVYAELENYDWVKSGCYNENEKDSLNHEILLVDSCIASCKGSRKVIIANTNQTDGDKVYLSLFEFKLDHQEWVLSRKSIAFFKSDEWDFQPLDMSLLSLGSMRYALLVTTEVQDEDQMELKSIFAFAGKKFKKVFSLKSEKYDLRDSVHKGFYIVPYNSDDDYTYIQLEAFVSGDVYKIFKLQDSAYVEVKNKKK